MNNLVVAGSGPVGLTVARNLAAQGASVTLVAPNEETSQEALEDIKAIPPNAHLTVLPVNLSSLADVRRLADTLLGRLRTLDTLIWCVARQFRQRQTSVDGIEMTWATNYLGPFLLTNLLLDLCRASSPMRLVTMVQVPHSGATLDLARLQPSDRYDAGEAFTQAQVALLIFTLELARLLEDRGISANAVDAGSAVSVEGLPGFLNRVSRRLGRPNGGDIEDVAAQIVLLASSPELEGVTGRFFVRGQPQDPALTWDNVTARRLWQISADMAGLPLIPISTSAAVRRGLSQSDQE